MKQAILESKKAEKILEVPVGCVIVCQNQIIGKGYNLKEKRNSSIEHAEIIAIKKASWFLNNWRLNECFLYVTKEPCPMCLSAILQARIKKIIWGMSDEKFGFRQFYKLKYYQNLSWQSWLLEKEITTNFKNFFIFLRKKTNKKIS